MAAPDEFIQILLLAQAGRSDLPIDAGAAGRRVSVDIQHVRRLMRILGLAGTGRGR
jgi:hypothetical protein